MGKEYDIVVAGAGHNGLIAAAYLAKAGLSVCAVEKQEYVGGGVATRELTIPGFKHDVCSIMHGNMQLNPIVWNDELKLLSKYGLSYIEPEESISVLYPDGKYLAFHRDLDTTCQRIAEFSEKDAEAYRKVTEWGMTFLDFFKEGLYKPPAPYGVTQSMMDQSPEGQELLRLFHMRTLEASKEWFESPEMVIALTRIISEGMLSPSTSGRAVSLLAYIPISHKLGFNLPVGGSGSLSEALVRCIEAHGGEIRTSSLITQFKLSANECTGVVLEDGEEIIAKKAVVTNMNVMQIPQMVGKENLPEEYTSKIDRLRLSDFMCFHMELALDEAPAYECGMTLREGWFVEYVDYYDLDDYMRTFDELAYGIPNTRAPLVMCPTVLDQGTRCPEGKHTLYVYQFAPHDLKDGGPERWDDIKEQTMDELVETVNKYAPNVKKSILGRWAMSPYDYARYNPSWPKGDFAHFNATVMQAAGYRPFAGWSNYKTPVDKLYICGPSTHPGWSVNGAARAAMWTIFEELGMDFEDMTK